MQQVQITALTDRSYLCAHAVRVHVLVAAVAVAPFGFCGHYQTEDRILCVFRCLNSVDSCSVGVND